jgi:hypothetical protein
MHLCIRLNFGQTSRITVQRMELELMQQSKRLCGVECARLQGRLLILLVELYSRTL